MNEKRSLASTLNLIELAHLNIMEHEEAIKNLKVQKKELMESLLKACPFKVGDIIAKKGSPPVKVISINNVNINYENNLFFNMTVVYNYNGAWSKDNSSRIIHFKDLSEYEILKGTSCCLKEIADF